MFSRYVAHVFSEWLSNIPSYPIIIIIIIIIIRRLFNAYGGEISGTDYTSLYFLSYIYRVFHDFRA